MNSKDWYKSKTVWFAVLTVALGVASAFGFGEFAPDEASVETIGTVVLVVVGGVNIVLRYLTKQPIHE